MKSSHNYKIKKKEEINKSKKLNQIMYLKMNKIINKILLLLFKYKELKNYLIIQIKSLLDMSLKL